MATDPNLVRDWLKMVGALNDAAMSPEEFNLRLAVLAPALAAEFDAAIFTPDTARKAARQTKYFPVFGEFCAFLEPLARDNREKRRVLALPPPGCESRVPYALPPPPPEKTPRVRISIAERDDMTGRSGIQEPIRTPEQQLAILRAMMAEERAAKREPTEEVPA